MTQIQLPAGFVRRMKKLLGEDWDGFLAGYELPLRRGLRVNTLKIETAVFEKVFSLPLSPAPFAEDSFYLDAPLKAGADPLFHAGAYYMQEPSASSAVTVLAPQPGERVLDLCAAPGGKSTQIAAALKGEGLLWSNEYVIGRARILEQNMERLGVRNSVISSAAPAKLQEGLPHFFDAVLVDAPCSGEGMFRKEPAALTEWSEDNISLCAARQREILTAAAQTVRPGGRLVYSTCTFAPEENECMAAWFLDIHPDFEPVNIAVPFGREGFPFEKVAAFATDVTGERFAPAACRRIFPSDGGEGHFIAAFRRREGERAFVPPYAYPAPTDVTKEAAALYADCFTDSLYGVPAVIGDTVRLLPAGLPSLKNLGVLRAGVQLADILKNRLEPSHSAYMAAGADACSRRVTLAPDDPRLTAFLRGEQIDAAGEKGFTAVTVNGVTCGFGKLSGGALKNRYPKGLRLL